MTLTDKEQKLLDAVTEGMDAPGEGWLYEIDPFDNPHTTAGVLSSLLEKGLVSSHVDGGDTWVELA